MEFLLLLLLAMAAGAHAAERSVNSAADSGPGTLREALALSANGDIIYIGTPAEIILVSPLGVNVSVDIRGAGAIRRAATATTDFAVFEVTAPNVTISHLTIRGGSRSAIQVKTAGNFTAMACTITENSSISGGGGALKIEGGALATIQNCTIRGNTAIDGSGGGINLKGSSLRLIGSTVAENITTGANLPGGGGLMINGPGYAQIISSTFSGNRPAGKGGAIHIGEGGGASLLCCTVTENGTPGQKAGGIWNEGSLAMGSSILSGNKGRAPADCSGPVDSFGNNLAGDVSGGGFNSTGDFTGVLDPQLYPLDDYGGPTPTCPPVDGNNLVIDRGCRTFPGFEVAVDQRGLSRAVDGDSAISNGDESDIGAVEVQDQQPAPSDTLLVNDNSDVADDGVAGVANTTLREALRAAARRHEIKRIVIQYTGGTVLNRRLPPIRSDLSIEGPGANVFSIQGYLPEQSRFFEVPPGVRLALKGITFTKGDAATLPEQEAGGAIWNRGELQVESCEFTNNRSPYRGGAIYCSDGASSRISNSTFAGNAAGEGGAISVDAASVTIIQCTFSGNGATSPVPGDGGGAVALHSGQITMKGCTVVFNTTLRGGGLVRRGGTFTLSSNLIGDNEASLDEGRDLQGEFASTGFNLVTNPGSASGLSPALGDITGEAPRVASLAATPGTTRVHMLTSASAAIDHGTSSGLATDQRGRPRMIHGKVDIGSAEYDPPQATLSIVVNSHDDVDDGVAGIDHTSLREAIRAADGGGRPILIGSSDGHSPPPPITIPITIPITKPLPPISRGVTITGSSARSVILDASGKQSASSLFAIGSRATVKISGVTITRCAGGGGPAIYNSGDLVVIDCQLENNTARAAGGAVYQSSGVLSFVNSTFLGNSGTNGGACCVQGGNMTFEQCTFQGNTGTQGGAVHVGTGAKASLKSCTVTGNKAGAGAGIYQSNATATVTLANTIVAGNSYRDLLCPSGSTGFASGGFNLIGIVPSSAIVSLKTDRMEVGDPKLGPPRNNGGPTDTMMPLANSYAIDRGNAQGLDKDQRGFPRTYNHPRYGGIEASDNTDIGAMELGPMSYEQWTQLHFTTEEFTAGVTASNLDPYGTGMENSLKYFFNIGPSGSIRPEDRSALPTLERTVDEGREFLHLTYRKNAFIITGNEKILYSENFDDWSNSVAKPVQVGNDPATLDPIFRASVEVTGRERAFLRLEWP